MSCGDRDGVLLFVSVYSVLCAAVALCMVVPRDDSKVKKEKCVSRIYRSLAAFVCLFLLQLYCRVLKTTRKLSRNGFSHGECNWECADAKPFNEEEILRKTGIGS